MRDLVDVPGGAPRVGRWDHPLADPNLEDAGFPHALDRWVGRRGLGWAEAAYRQRLRLKSWQYMTVVSDGLFLAFVVGTAGFASNGFVYAVELPGGAVHQRFAVTPLTVGAHVAPSSVAGSHRFGTRGLAISIDNQERGRRFTAHIDARTEAGGRLAADLVFSSSAHAEHLAQCVPLPEGRWSYTHKFGAFGVSGRVVLGDRTIELSPDRAFGTLDFTKQYAQRHSVWRWIALAGRTRHGKVIGINLVDPTPDAPVSENAVWIDGRREALTGVRIEPVGDGVVRPWRLSADTLDLEMTPVTHVEQVLDLPVIKQRLVHMVGRFSGRLRTATGHVHDLTQIVGIAEDYDTWW